MFAEELSGNKSQKRKEEAKKRRLRLKQQQQQQNIQKQKQQDVNGTTTKSDVKNADTNPNNSNVIVGEDASVGLTSVKSIKDEISDAPSEAVSFKTSTTINTTPTTLLSTTTTPSSSSSSLVTPTPTPLPSTISTTTSSSSSAPSAVTKALQQRAQRAQIQRQNHAITTIQSYIRAHLSNTRLLQNQYQTLQQRVTDVILLKQMVKEKAGVMEYIPPPAVVVKIICQLNFVFHCIPRFHVIPTVANDMKMDIDTVKQQQERIYHSKIRLLDSTNTTGSTPTTTTTKTNSTTMNSFQSLSQLLSQILTHVILPGLTSTDEHVHPILSWMESKEGMIQLKKLVRIVIYCFSRKFSSSLYGGGTGGRTGGDGGQDEVYQVLTLFLKVLLNPASSTSKGKTFQDKRDVLQSYCHGILFTEGFHGCKNNSGNSGIGGIGDGNISPNWHSIGQLPIVNEDLDLIRTLRSLLLYQGKQCPELTTPSKSFKNSKTANSFQKKGAGGSTISKINNVILPKDGETLREKSISTLHQQRCDDLFNLLLNIVNESKQSQMLQCRIVSELWTCPLLTWYLNADTVSRLVTTPTPSSSPSPSSSSCIFITYLRSFLAHFHLAISNGSIMNVLPIDLPLDKCPAPIDLCFLANLIQMGRVCPSINASDRDQLDVDDATMYFNFLSTLMDTVSLGAFSSQTSHVEWINDNSHSKPVVISPIIRNQCKALLANSYVRDLFHVSIDVEAMDVMAVLEKKDDKDKKQEKDLEKVGVESSSRQLAAREAMQDRSKSFWQKSKWAQQLSKKMTSMMSRDKNTSKNDKRKKGEGVLVNTSSISREIAHKGVSSNMTAKAVVLGTDKGTKSIPLQKKPYSHRFFFALCRVYGTILSRFGGKSKESFSSLEQVKNQQTEKMDLCVRSLLNVLCFSSDPIVKILWSVIQSHPSVITDLYDAIDDSKRPIPIRTYHLRPKFDKSGYAAEDVKIGVIVLFIFAMSFAHILIVTDDSEFYEGNPLPLHQIRRCILLLKRILYRACWIDVNAVKHRGIVSNHFGISLLSSSSKIMKELFDRSSRRPICVPKLWIVEDLLEKEIRHSDSFEHCVSLLNCPVLRVSFYLVSFKRRLKLFEKIITTSRKLNQREGEGFRVSIMRGRELEDGLRDLNKLGRNLRQRVIVNYVNQTGAKEAGIDSGGLFKEFWTNICTQLFNPNFALFCATEGSGNCLYPSPSSRAAHGLDSIVMFEFLGRILGKALYENITVQPQFAHFFLAFLRGDYNFFHMLPDLSLIEPTLYNNLMFLKTYEGDAEDLCLTFTVTNDNFGRNIETNLVANGANIDVSDTNKHHYIGLVAKHYVYDRVKEQSEAFTRGLWDVIDKSWLRIFNEPELQVLISGPTNGVIDIDDLKAHTRYVGGYTGLDRNIYRFWKVVGSMNQGQKAGLLKFVTSCERPPPLGFQSMNPSFTIQRVGISRDEDKLPTSSTCFNILKLPTYSSENVMRKKLLYVIEAGAGFELA